MATVALAGPERARRIATVLWVILGLNWTVSLCKLLLGHSIGSTAVFADGLHSFSDGASNIIGLVAISIARHPADHDHPYGHQKYETLAATGIAFLLLLAALHVFSDAARALAWERTPRVDVRSFLVMGGTLAVNLFVAFYERRMARRLSSDLLRADSWHTMTDVFVTLTVLASMVLAAMGFGRADAVLAFGVGILIVWTAASIIKTSSDVLCDKAPLEPSVIEGIVRAVPGVIECHEVRTRGRQDAIHVDLHALVEDTMSVLDSHRLANRIERNIRERVPGVLDVVVHIEPRSHDHGEG